MRSERMKGHLIGQFHEKPVLAAVLETLGEELEEIAQAFRDLKEKRWIDTGEGVQLDGIGQILDRPRQIEEAVQLEFFGFRDQANAKGFEEGRFRDSWEGWLKSCNLNDIEYRAVLWMKVFKNCSRGTAEDTIRSLKFIYGAEKVILEELGNAKIAFAIRRRLDSNAISVASAVDLLVRAGGVGVVCMEHFDYTRYFGFDDQVGAKGFDVGTFADMFGKIGA